MAQITDNSMEKRLRQVIFMGSPSLKLNHHIKGLSSKSSWEIFVLITKLMVVLKRPNEIDTASRRFSRNGPANLINALN